MGWIGAGEGGDGRGVWILGDVGFLFLEGDPDGSLRYPRFIWAFCLQMRTHGPAPSATPAHTRHTTHDTTHSLPDFLCHSSTLVFFETVRDTRASEDLQDTTTKPGTDWGCP